MMPREAGRGDRARSPYRCWAVGICAVLLLLSWGWEWMRMYQEKVAEKTAKMAEGYPDDCSSAETRGYWASIKAWMRGQMSWAPSPCKEYHKALQGDPFWEVNPLTALTAAVTRSGVSQPLEEISASIGRSLRLLFQEIPAQWQAVILILLFIALILKLVMACGYSIQAVFFSFGPAPNVADRTHPAPPTTAVEHQAVGETLQNEQGMIDGHYNHNKKVKNQVCPPKKLAIEPSVYLQDQSYRDSGYSGVSVSERARLFESPNAAKSND